MVKSAISFLCTSLCALTLCGATFIKKTDANQENCGQGPRHKHVTLRYTTPKGIGYKAGYTTLELFLAPQSLLQDSWIPFLDLRGHVFDNGKMAANAGLGFRYLSGSRIWGANSYYDYRNTHHGHYNQFAAGFENLGKIWDFRLNGYLPVGKTHSSFSGPKFFAFKGHHLFLGRSQNFSMKGANAEAGVHVDHFKKIPLYFAGGPYYLTGKGETTWGGELRTAIDFFDRYLRVEGNVSYDHFFKWIGQAQASVNIPFGKRSKVKKRENFSCSNAIVLETRAIQRVDRNEIIPVVRQNNVSLAINPKTGQPWVFWFVNNTSSSDGTYESPYPTLLLAQNASSHDEVIYVYPGDGTTNGMSNGIALKNAQMLLGASVSHPIPTTVGTVIIPPLASIMPKITNATGDVVTLMNDNVVSGFNITISNGNGLTGLVTSNFMADRNAFSTIANDTNGIFLADASGQIIINDNTFNGFSAVATSNGNGILINLNAGNTLPLTSISGNHFNNISNPAGGNGGNAFLVNVTGTLVSLNASKNSFNNIDSSAGGITLNMLGGTIESTNISDNNFNGLTTGSNGVVLLLNVANSTITSTNITNNTFTTMTGSSAGVSLDNVLGTVPYLNISRNTFNDIRDISRGFTYTSSLGSTSFLSAGNKFTGNAPIPNGYAAIVTVSGGSTCIDFINDSAAPTSAPNPYAFQGLGGTFNRTSGSDNSTNTGQFSIIGVVGAPGSCTP